MKIKSTSKIVAWVLTFALVLSLLPTMSLTVSANTDLLYSNIKGVTISLPPGASVIVGNGWFNISTVFPVLVTLTAAQANGSGLTSFTTNGADGTRVIHITAATVETAGGLTAYLNANINSNNDIRGHSGNLRTNYNNGPLEHGDFLVVFAMDIDWSGDTGIYAFKIEIPDCEVCNQTPCVCAGLTYTVTFNTNGGSAIGNVTVTEGNTITAPTAPTKEGYAFGGWYRNSALTQLWDFNAHTVTENITLYAKWTAAYTVTFNTDGGSAIENVTVLDGGTITAPANPTKGGYSFSGWFTDTTLTTLWHFNANFVYGNITLYAKWTAVHTVTFDTDGGNAIGNVSVVDGDRITAPTAPVKATFVFDGWYKDTDLTIPWDFDVNVVTENVTLYAKWKATVMPDTPTGMFNLADGTWNGVPWDEATMGDANNISWNSPILTVKDIANIEVTGNVVGTNSSNRYRIVVDEGATASITLNNLSIRLGDSVASPLLLNAGANLFLTIAGTNTLTGEGSQPGIQAPAGTTLTIDGTGSLAAIGGNFSAGIGGGGHIIIKGGILFNGDSGTVYGNVELENDLTLTANQTLTIPDNAKLTILSGVTLTNYGTINNKGTIENNGTIINKGTVINIGTTVGWDLYTVTFNTTGGSAIGDVNAANGDKIIAPTVPVKVNYTFGGWYKNENLTMPWDFAVDVVMEDVTLYAKWLNAVWWNSNGNNLTVQDGDIVVIAAGATGTLTVPAGAEITILGGSAHAPIDNGTNRISFDIHETAKVIWQAHYTSHTGNYTEISDSSAGVFEVAGGSIKNTNGMAIINDSTNTKLIVSGGSVYSKSHTGIASYGDVIITGGKVESGGMDAISMRNNAFLFIDSDVEVVANILLLNNVVAFINSGATFTGNVFTGNASGTNSIGITKTTNATEFYAGHSTGLDVVGTVATAVWAVQDGKSGIRYARGTNTGFFEVPGVVVEAIFVNGVEVGNRTVANIQSAITNALANNDEVKVTGRFTGADSSLTLLILAGKTLVWDAEYTGSANNLISITGNNSAGIMRIDSNGVIRATGDTVALNTGSNINRNNVNIILNGGTVTKNAGTMPVIALYISPSLSILSGSIEGNVVANNSSIVYVADGNIVNGDIQRGGSAIGYYTGDNAAKFRTSGSDRFTPGTNLFQLDVPTLTNNDGDYIYDNTTPYAGAITATFPAVLTVTSVTANNSDVTAVLENNEVQLTGNYNGEIALTVTGTLANGRIPVSFTTAAFGVNVDTPLESTTVTVTAPDNIAYGETLGEPTAEAAAGNVGMFTFYYTGTIADGNTYDSDDKPTLPGEYTVTATLVSDRHYGSGESATFTISPKQLTWNADGTVLDKTFDGDDSAIIETAPTLDGIINNDNVTVTNGTVNFASANVGTWAVTAISFGIEGDDEWKYTISVQPTFANGTITASNFTDKTYTVTFSVAGTNGTITALSGGMSITTGAQVLEGATVTFTATPTDGYRVKEWKNNNTVVNGKAPTYSTQINAATNVTVEFEEVPENPPEFELGDCNNDGKINIADLTYLKHAIVGALEKNDQCKVAGKEATDAQNLSALRNYLTRKEAFPGNSEN